MPEKIRPAFTFTEDRLAQLRAVVPEAFADGKVDWEALREALGEHLEDESQEHFGLSWPGKREARRLAALPPQGTLVPAPGEGVDEADAPHLFIEADNLEALKLLQKSYAGRVKMIYIDPPYNTGNDFIYEDDYSEPLETYLRRTGQMDEAGRLLTTNTRASGRFHSRWLSMMYPRLLLARQLLRDDGVIFVSIDDNEVHHLRMLMNEVFGEENFVATVIWQKVFSPKNTAKHFSEDHDYVLIYAKSADDWLPNLLPRGDEALARYQNPDNDPRGPWSSSDLTARNYYGAGLYEVTSPGGKKFGPGIGRYWRSSYEKFLELDADGRIWWGEDGNNMPRLKRFLSEVKNGVVPQTLWKHEEVGNTQEAKKELLQTVTFQHSENVLNTIKPTRLLKRLLQISTRADENEIVMDFFCGSASTAHAVLLQNHEDGGRRQFIMVQLPEPLPKPEPQLATIADIGKERIRRVIRKLKEANNGQLSLVGSQLSLVGGQPSLVGNQPSRLGFRVFKLARSHFRGWAPVPPEEAGRVNDLFAQSPLVEGWTPDGLLTEILLLEGFPLDSRVVPLGDAFPENDVRRVHHPDVGHELFVCLDAAVRPATVDRLLAGDALRRDDIFICLDSALTDEAKIRLDDRLRLKVI